jgi:hypothetical protein
MSLNYCFSSEPATASEVPVVDSEDVKETPEETSAVPNVEVKVGRRLSAGVGSFFKSKPKTEAATPTVRQAQAGLGVVGDTSSA